jgi:acyl-coenzyme A synthetase/AMP-(fatty) acid ligase
MALLNGGALYPWDIRREGLGGLPAWMNEEAITVYRSSTSVFRYLADGLGGRDNFPALRLLTFASEPAYARDVERFRERFARSCLLVNALSASETGTIATHFVDPDAPLPDRLVPVGLPLDGVEILLLREDGAPAPPGAAREIAVRGRYLSAGYWNEPELTRATFSPDPQGGDARVYRTGDLGRILPDGALVHLGRRDFQVMIRGFRVETGEVELALRDHPGVAAAAVVAGPDARGETALIGYVVPARKPGPDASDLRDFLRRRLPAQMVPAAIVALDELPVTGAGKIDRRALPAPGARASRVAPVAPRTPLEERLAGIWSEVLGLDSVGVEDSFLDLGGNSLLATMVVNRVLGDVRTDVSVAALLAASTVAGMAVVVAAHLAQGLPTGLLSELVDGDPPGRPDAVR